jgi:hypothetical protein
MLKLAGLLATGGMETGQDTHSQPGLAFSDDHESLYAVNSGDNSITVCAADIASDELCRRFALEPVFPIVTLLRVWISDDSYSRPDRPFAQAILSRWGDDGLDGNPAWFRQDSGRPWSAK